MVTTYIFLAQECIIIIHMTRNLVIFIKKVLMDKIKLLRKILFLKNLIFKKFKLMINKLKKKILIMKNLNQKDLFLFHKDFLIRKK